MAMAMLTPVLSAKSIAPSKNPKFIPKINTNFTQIGLFYTS